MRKYKSIEEWDKNFIKEKRDLYDKYYESKYGEKSDNSMLLINDKELSEITGDVVFNIKIDK